MRQVGVDIRKGREIGRMLSVGEEKRGCKHRIGWIKEEKEHDNDNNEIENDKEDGKDGRERNYDSKRERKKERKRIEGMVKEKADRIREKVGKNG